MSLLLRVKALAEAVGADIKSIKTDPRLTDSREWSEETVTQAEAEAGIASTRRAWTAQRVRQAINAWWQLVTSGFGRNFIAASNEQAARNALQLGTAATRNVGTGTGDVMEVGTFGYGGVNPVNNTYDVNDLPAGQRITLSDGITEADAVAQNLPALGGSGTASRSWHVECVGRATSRLVQTATEVYGVGTTKGRTFTRVKHDTWYPWQEVPKANVDGKLSTNWLKTDVSLDPLSVTDVLLTRGAHGIGDVGTHANFQAPTSLLYNSFWEGNCLTINSKESPYGSMLILQQDKLTYGTVNDTDGIWVAEIITDQNQVVLGKTPATARAALELGTAATKDIGTAVGQVMEVGAFGAGHTFTGGVFDANAIANTVGNKSGFYPHVSNAGSANIPYPYVYIQQLFHDDSNLTQIAYGYNTPVVWVRHRYSDVWSPWAKQLSTGDILQTTGSSTDFPMSQAATTAALSGKVDKTNIVQESGQSTTAIMSQKAVTDAIAAGGGGGGGGGGGSSSLQASVKVTVGAGGDFPTINAAILHLSRFVPDLGVTAEVELMSGFVMSEQLLVEGLNLGWITITGVDAQTVINAPSLTRVLVEAWDARPAFCAINGTLPTIGQLFIFSSKGSVGDARTGVMVHNIGRAFILEGCGVENASTFGIAATDGSTINTGEGAIASGAGESGFMADGGSTINAGWGAIASGAGMFGFYSQGGSTINASGGIASNAGIEGFGVAAGGTLNAGHATGSLSQTKNTVTSHGIIFQ